MAAAQRIIIPYSPRKQFLPYHNRTERFSAILAHRRAGKTVSTINELIRSALMCENRSPRVAYIAPYYKQAKAVAWTYAKEFGLKIPNSKANESELRIDFPNGGQFRLFGADNVDALRGIYLDDVILDEYADMNPRLFPEVIRPALVDRNGKATFIGTPKGKNDFYKICKHAQKSDDWFFLRLRASETKIVPPHELVALRSEMTEEQFLQEFECSFEASILGAYFGKELHQANQEGRIRDFDFEPEAPVNTAWDIGFTDDTAIWFYQIIAGEVRIIDYHAKNGEGADYYSDMILSKPYKYGTHWLPIDSKFKNMSSYGKSTFDQLALKLGWDKMRVNKKETHQNGINAARLMMPKTYFHQSKCEEGLEALMQYQREWDADRKCFRDKPKHDWTSHPADAFRYLAMSWQEEYKTQKPPAKPQPDYGFNDYDEDNDWLLN